MCKQMLRKMWATILSAAGLTWVGAIPAVAFDPPSDDSPSRIAQALKLRDKLAPSLPPTATEAVMKDGKLWLTAHTAVPETRTEIVTEQRDGRIIEVARTVTTYRHATFLWRAPENSVKAFIVTKDGTLKAHDAKIAELFAKPTPVLCGDTEQVDARHLELIKPGTIYLMVPPGVGQRTLEEGVPLPRGDKEGEKR